MLVFVFLLANRAAWVNNIHEY